MTISSNKPMPNSYKAIFIFSIAMSILTLLAGNKGGIGTLFWGYVAWMMHKRNNDGLIKVFKVSLWLLAFSIFMGFILLANGTFEEKWFGYSAQGYFLIMIVAGAIDFALLNYFQNIVNQDRPINVASSESTSTKNYSDIMTDKHHHKTSNTVFTNQEIIEEPNTDDQIYLKINEELEGVNKDKALWLKLFAECDGDDNKTKAGYIRQRFKDLKNQEISSKQSISREYKNGSEIASVRTVASDNVESQKITEESIREHVNLYHIDRDTAIDMIKYKIWYSNQMFIYKTYRYEKLIDAIAFAKLEESKLNS